MSRRCIINVATGIYPRWQRRLIYSLSRTGLPGALLTWTNEMPEGSKHHSVDPYGFKIHAFEAARKAGFESILWIDSGLYAIRSIAPVFSAIESDGYYLLEDSNSIAKFCSDETLRYYGMTRKDVAPWRLISGALVGIDFTSNQGRLLWDRWRTAYDAGLYKGTVSKHSGMEDHRGDETILGISSMVMGLRRHTVQDHMSPAPDRYETTVLHSGYFDYPEIPETLWKEKPSESIQF